MHEFTPVAHFPNMDYFESHHALEITFTVNCGMKLLIQQLKFMEG